MSMNNIAKKRLLEKANNQITTEDPYETDVELWKAFWEQGIELECAWNRAGANWMRVAKQEENTRGVAFRHGGTKVKFRRKVK